MTIHDNTGTRRERRTTFDVRIWKLAERRNKNGISYRVRWFTAGAEQHDTFPSHALADAFRSQLITAARRGEAFDIDTGLPSSLWGQDTAPAPSAETEVGWFSHACAFVDMNWTGLAPNTRAIHANALAVLTTGMLDTDPDTDPDLAAETGTGAGVGVETREVRQVLVHWAFNRTARAAGPPTGQDQAAIAAWLAGHTDPVTDLADPDRLRALLDHMASTATGAPVAAHTVRIRRRTLNQVLDYAVEHGHLETNPLKGLRWNAPRPSGKVNPRVVINTSQAEDLLRAVGELGGSGAHLVAFFALLYYAGLRPAEAADLREDALTLPHVLPVVPPGAQGVSQPWGEVVLPGSAPDIATEWSGASSRRPSRSLKHRPDGEVRRVPLEPRLIELLRAHLQTFGTTGDGRLFHGPRGGPLNSSSYRYIWRRARQNALTAAQAASPLARRPYDLRHAAVSFWLNSGVPATQVAQWAGHSVAILLTYYASCIHGHDHRPRIQTARQAEHHIGHQSTPAEQAPEQHNGQHSGPPRPHAP